MGQNAFRDLPISGILFYALVGGLFGPLFGLLMASLAKNKIEGFAYLKSLGILLLVPVLVMVETFQDIKQYILGIIPGFWPIKGLLESASILQNKANLPAFVYFTIGSIYMLIMIGLLTYLFQKNISE
jgi:fluoroquinolone transport system permease protein